MNKQILHTDHAPKAVGPYSQAVMVGDFLYCSGQIAIDPKTNEVLKVSIKDQTHQVMKNIEAVLKQATLNFGSIVKTTIFVTDMNDFAAVNEVYSSYLQAPYPARSTVGVSALPKGVNVEIEVVAVKS